MLPERVGRGISPAVGADLIVKIIDMALHGPQADLQLPGNSNIGLSVSDAPEHLDFAAGQAGGIRPVNGFPVRAVLER